MSKLHSQPRSSHANLYTNIRAIGMPLSKRSENSGIARDLRHRAGKDINFQKVLLAETGGVAETLSALIATNRTENRPERMHGRGSKER